MKTLILILLLIPNCIFADTILLRNGGIIKNIQVNEGYDYVLYYDNGNRVQFEKSIVWKIVRPGVDNSFVSESFLEKTPEVVLLSNRRCWNCSEMRNLLNEYDIAFSEFDIEKTPNILTKFKELGDINEPVLLINGNPVRELDPPRIRDLLMNS